MTIYSFSGTGNSLKAARDIASKCGGSVVPIREPLPIPAPDDAIGFVFPCYFGAIPNMVERFIRKARFTADYFFAVITYGGSAGNAIYDTDALLKSKGLKLDYGGNVIAYPNYVAKYPMFRNPLRTTPKQDKKVSAIAEDALARRQTKTPKRNRLFASFSEERSKFAEMDGAFSVSGDCVSCGICAKLCPAGNIEISDGKPRFQHKCEQCMACVQWCPSRAINTPKTIKRGRYHHPAITAEDMMGE
jgi:ferredoxin